MMDKRLYLSYNVLANLKKDKSFEVSPSWQHSRAPTVWDAASALLAPRSAETRVRIGTRENVGHRKRDGRVKRLLKSQKPLNFFKYILLSRCRPVGDVFERRRWRMQREIRSGRILGCDK